MEHTMKRSRIVTILAAVCVGLTLASLRAQTVLPASRPASAPAAAFAAGPSGPTRVAVCDISAAFRNYDRLRDLNQVLRQKNDALKAENARRTKQVEDLQKELQDLKPGSKQYQAKLEERDKAAVEGAVSLQYQKGVLDREQRQLTEDMFREILAAVSQVAQERGYDLVLARDSVDVTSLSMEELMDKMIQRKCLYSSPQIDLTEEVTQRANAAYKKP
jgi:Skp family chaperone for outer membrane proteins